MGDGGSNCTQKQKKKKKREKKFNLGLQKTGLFRGVRHEGVTPLDKSELTRVQHGGRRKSSEKDVSAQKREGGE